MSNILEQVFRDGALIDLRCSFWRGQFKLRPVDLGLEESNIPDFFSLGRKRLFPKAEYDKFSKIEHEVRSYIYNNSLSFPISGLYFIPIALIPTVTAFTDTKVVQFNAMTDNFITRYTNIRAEMLDKYEEVAEVAYQNMVNNGNGHEGVAAFKERLIQHVKKLYPSSTELQAKYNLSYRLFTVHAPNLEMNENNVGNLLDTAEERRRLTEQYQQQMEEQIREFVDDAVAQLRGRIVEALTSLRNAFNSSKSVTEKTMNYVRRTVGQFRNLNFMGDERVEELLQQFEEEYLHRDAKEYRDNNALLNQFRQATNEALQSATDATDVSNVTGKYIRRLNLE